MFADVPSVSESDSDLEAQSHGEMPTPCGEKGSTKIATKLTTKKIHTQNPEAPFLQRAGALAQDRLSKNDPKPFGCVCRPAHEITPIKLDLAEQARNRPPCPWCTCGAGWGAAVPASRIACSNSQDARPCFAAACSESPPYLVDSLLLHRMAVARCVRRCRGAGATLALRRPRRRNQEETGGGAAG